MEVYKEVDALERQMRSQGWEYESTSDMGGEFLLVTLDWCGNSVLMDLFFLVFSIAQEKEVSVAESMVIREILFNRTLSLAGQPKIARSAKTQDPYK